MNKRTEEKMSELSIDRKEDMEDKGGEGACREPWT